jgi:hypothetical protein
MEIPFEESFPQIRRVRPGQLVLSLRPLRLPLGIA